MKCPNCGTENDEDAGFCVSCGAALTKTPSEDPREAPAEDPSGAPMVAAVGHETAAEAAEAPPARRSLLAEVGAVLALGWPRAVVRSLVAFVVILLLSAAIVLLAEAANPSGLSFFEILKVIGLVFYAFHHAGIQGEIARLEVPQTPENPFAGSLDFSFTISLALMLGTFLSMWLLYRGGRDVAGTVGGVAWARVLHGAKVAAPYALLSLALSFGSSFSIDLPQSPFLPTGGPFEFGPSPIAAFLWPLALGLLAGGLGGLVSAERWMAPEGLAPRVRAVVRGGLVMTLYGLILAFLGYLVAVAVNPDIPLPFSPDFFQQVTSDGLAGINLLLITILVIPNIAVWVLVAAMGGNVGVSIAGASFEVLSYSRFPTGISATQDPSQLVPIPGLPQFDTAPAPYFLLLLVPLAATLLGGWWTARRAPARSRGDGAAVGALAGVVFAVALTLLVVLASIGIGFSGGVAGFVQTGRGHVGPPLLLGTLLALVWGTIGGALGGLIGSRGAVPVTTARAPAPPGMTGFEGPPPAEPPEPPGEVPPVEEAPPTPAPPPPTAPPPETPPAETPPPEERPEKPPPS